MQITIMWYLKCHIHYIENKPYALNTLLYVISDILTALWTILL